jgi:hypothetical protein
MKSAFKLALLFFLFVFASCELISEAIDSRSDQEKVIDLLTKGGIWSVDSLVAQVKSEAPGSSIVTSDSLFLKFGTWEFQDPNNDKNPGFNAGYLIHKYTKKGSPRIDTLAWVPYNFASPSSEIPTLTIFFPDPSVQNRDMVVDDTENYFLYLKKEENVIRIEGGFGYNVGSGATRIINYKRYHLAR